MKQKKKSGEERNKGYFSLLTINVVFCRRNIRLDDREERRLSRQNTLSGSCRGKQLDDLSHDSIDILQAATCQMEVKYEARWRRRFARHTSRSRI